MQFMAVYSNWQSLTLIQADIENNVKMTCNFFFQYQKRRAGYLGK